MLMKIFRSFTSYIHRANIHNFSSDWILIKFGKIYWTEANDAYQKLYGSLNMRAGVVKKNAGLYVWTRNSLNTDYAAFLFKTGGQTFAQKGAPFQMGVDLTLLF